MENKQIIIGISPGTSLLGFAVFRRGELVNFGVKSYRGEWSKNKLLLITSSVRKLTEQYKPDTIILKVTDTGTKSKSVQQIHERIAKLIDKHRIKLSKCTLEDIKRACGSGKFSNSQELYASLMEQYPVLSIVNKKRLNWHTYYGKMFEAVGSVNTLE